MISRSNFIHLARWISALIVVINHLRSIVFRDFKFVNGGKSGVFIKIFYLVTGLGHQAVMVFFVISGYLISSSVIKQFRQNQFNFNSYLLARFSRLYSVLVIALILTIALDYIGIKNDQIGIYSKGFSFAAMNFSVIERSSIGHFLCSLFMLQNIILPPLGSNGPLWSLNYEFFYYLIFPCLAILFFNLKERSNFRRSLPVFVVVSILIYLLPSFIMSYFLIWLLGLIPIFLTFKLKLLKYILPLILIGFIAVQKLHPIIYDSYIYDLIVAFLFSTWLSCYKEVKVENNLIKINERIASFSYTLYLVHLPFLLCLLTIINSLLGLGISMQPSKSSFLIFSLVLIFIYLFSYLIASFTEFKTYQFKIFVIRKIHKFLPIPLLSQNEQEKKSEKKKAAAE